MKLPFFSKATFIEGYFRSKQLKTERPTKIVLYQARYIYTASLLNVNLLHVLKPSLICFCGSEITFVIIGILEDL